MDRRHDQVVEVERVGLAQAPLVERVGLGQRLLDVGLGPGGEVSWSTSSFLRLLTCAENDRGG